MNKMRALKLLVVVATVPFLAGCKTTVETVHFKEANAVFETAGVGGNAIGNDTQPWCMTDLGTRNSNCGVGESPSLTKGVITTAVQTAANIGQYNATIGKSACTGSNCGQQDVNYVSVQTQVSNKTNAGCATCGLVEE